MTQDRRRLAFDGRTALASLMGQVDAENFTDGFAASVIQPSAPLNRVPGRRMDKELLFGEQITVISKSSDHSFVQSAADGYCGYVSTDALGPAVLNTHHVSARSTHIYAEADFKSAPCALLSFNAQVEVLSIHGRFAQTSEGWLPLQHLSALETPAHDPIGMAELFLGTPYLWGGNTGFGIDCSGLVQAAHLACGIECPRDSDMQAEEFGKPVSDRTNLLRGDLVFWKGHVGMLRDANTLLHANAHHMATASEPLGKAISRIGAQEFGEVTAIKRLANRSP